MDYKYIPTDCISIILNNCNYKTSISLSLTCKSYNKLYVDFFNIQRKFNGVKLKYYQYLAINKLVEKSQIHNELYLCFIMGGGKTLSSLYYIYNVIKNDRVLIMVPPTVLKTWMDELMKLNLYHANPLQSKIIVLHSTRQNHYVSYINNYKLNNVFLTHNVIITTTHIASRLEGEVDTIIMDEGHHNHYTPVKHKKLIRLTAERKEGDQYITFGFENKEEVPTINYNWHIIEGDNNLSMYNDHIKQFTTHQKEYINQLINVIKSYHKTCIFVDRGQIGDSIYLILINFLQEYKIFTLKNSLQAYHQHLKYKDKSILLLSTITNEGLNLLVDNIILIKPDIYGTTRLKQTIGRILRPNNPHKNVNVHFITNGRLGVLKILYAITYSNIDWTFNFSESPSHDLLLKSETIIKLIGYTDITKFNLVDYCILFDDAHSNKPEKIQWWLKYHHNSKLTLDTVKLILN